MEFVSPAFNLIKVLGRGSFSQVVLCREIATNELAAMKILHKQAAKESLRNFSYTLAESQALKRIRHPFLTTLKYSFESKEYVCFVMEYVSGGDLFHYIMEEGKLPEACAIFYAAEIVSALGYLHNMNVVYRNLKMANVLLDSDGHVKLTELDFCKQNFKFGQRTNSFSGIPEYMAPEIYLGHGYGKAVDWWSLGVVLYEMLFGDLPFSEFFYLEVLAKQVTTSDIEIPEEASPKSKKLLLGLLNRNPGERLGGKSEDATEIMRQPFFSTINWEDLLQRKITPPYIPPNENLRNSWSFVDFSEDSVESSSEDEF